MMKVWHAILIGLAIAAYIKPVWLKRGLLFALIFFCITG